MSKPTTTILRPSCKLQYAIHDFLYEAVYDEFGYFIEWRPRFQITAEQKMRLIESLAEAAVEEKGNK